jgi:hypothetical protein
MKRHIAEGIAASILLSALGASAPSHAAAINICDAANCGSTPGLITVTAADFEKGFVANGSLLSNGLHTSGSIVVPESVMPINFAGSWIDNGLATPGTSTIFLTNDFAQIMGVLSYTYSTDGHFGSISGFAIADGGGVLPPSAYAGLNPTVTVEANGPYSFNNAFITASFTAASGPSPGNGLFSLAALAVVGLFARYRGLIV